MISLLLSESPPAQPAGGTEGSRELLVCSWLRPADAESLADGCGIPAGALDDYLARAHIVEAAQSGNAIAIAAPPAGEHLVPAAVAGTPEAIWRALIEGLDGLVAVGTPPVDGQAVLGRFDAMPARRRTDVSIDRFRVERPGGPSCWVSVRRAPAPVRSGGTRETAVFLLPGLGSGDRARFEDRLFLDGLDAVGASGRPLLVASINTRSEHGTHYLSRRSLEDGWADLLARTIPAEIAARYPDSAPERRQIVAGTSSGAFNALVLAMLVPGAFDSVLAAAPDALDLEMWLLGADGRVKDRWLTWMRFEERLRRYGQMSSYAVSFAATGQPFRWPARLSDGANDSTSLEGWRDASPVNLLGAEASRAALHEMNGRIFLAVAENDEFDLAGPARSFARRLGELGIAHRWVGDRKGHFASSTRLIQLLTKALAEELRGA